MIFTSLSISIMGYFIGCIHGSAIAQKLSGVNLKSVGSGNAGASNATLTLGWKYGVLVAVIDIFKGVLAIILLRLALPYIDVNTTEANTLLYLMASAVILGHNFPLQMKFKGGKGTASLIGTFIALDWQMSLLGLSLFVVIGIATNYLVIGLLALYITFITITACYYGVIPTLITLLLFSVTIWLHIPNIKNIFTKTEPKVRNAFKKKVT